jgi:hypothetical protein
MALPVFVVSTAGSEGVLGVFSGSDNWYILLSKDLSPHTSQNIPRLLLPYKCYTHMKAQNWVSHDLGTDFCNFFGNEQSKYN